MANGAVKFSSGVYWPENAVSEGLQQDLVTNAGTSLFGEPCERPMCLWYNDNDDDDKNENHEESNHENDD